MYYIRYPWVILIDINCNQILEASRGQLLHVIPGDVLQRYDGTILFAAVCNTPPVIECAADSVLLTRYVIREKKSILDTNLVPKKFFSGVCITIQE